MKKVLEERHGPPNRRTVIHWLTVCLLSISGLLTGLTSIYFLFLPSGGYQGGRNPHYGQTFLVGRDIWSGIHTWAGIVLIAVSLLHIALHWRWVVEMAKRSASVIRRTRRPFNRKIWARISVVTVIGVLFLGVAASGIYLFLVPGGHGSSAAQFLLSRTSWDLIHTWTGVLMIVAVIVHLAMRWKWVARVTPNVARTLMGRKNRQPEGAPTWRSAS